MSKKSDERARGILTPTDREFLRGEKTYDNDQVVAHRRRDIRDRIRDSIADFTLLLEHLDESERDKIFNDAALDEYGIFESVDDLFAFMCLALENAEPDWRGRPNYRWELPRFEERVYFGVERAFEQKSIVTTDVDVNISVEGYIAEHIELTKEGVAHGSGSLDIHEMLMLIQAGEVDSDNLREFFQDEFGSPSESE